MKEEAKEKLRRLDRKASAIIRVIGYIVFIPILIILTTFTIINILVGPSVRMGHTNQKDIASSGPSAEAQSFDFFEFDTPTQLNSYLNESFPQGTPKDRVDEILVEQGNAEAREIEPLLFQYKHSAHPSIGAQIDCPARNTWSFKIRYTTKLVLSEIYRVSGPCI